MSGAVFIDGVFIVLLFAFLIFPIVGIFFCSTDKDVKTYGELWHFLVVPFSTLNLSEYSLSSQAHIHFIEVKHYVRLLEGGTIILTPLSVWWLKEELKNGYIYTWQRRIKRVGQSILVSIFLLSLFGFSQLFMRIHQLLFRNDYWMFEPKVDPIIQLFPLSFFIVMLMIILLGYCLLLFGLYILFKRKEDKLWKMQKKSLKK